MKLNRRLLAGSAILVATAAIAQDVTSPNLQLLLMGQGLHANDWGSLTNQNLTKLENAVTGVSTISVAGSGVTLTNDQARFASFILTGTLTQNYTLTLPGVPRDFNLVNGTTGNFSVTVSCGAGADVAVVQGEAYKLFCDGSAVYSATPRDLVPVGTMLPYSGWTPPDQNYRLCDGSELSRTEFSTLYSRIALHYGAGNGVTTFNIPDARGRVVSMLDYGTNRFPGLTVGTTTGQPTITLSQANLPNAEFTVSDPGHTHSIVDPGHGHTYTAPTNGPINTGTVGVSLSVNSASSFTSSEKTFIGINPSATSVRVFSGGSGTAFNNAQPTLGANCIIRVK